MERTSSAKLDEMFSFQKVAYDKTGLEYDFSSPNIASSSTTVFVSPVNNVNSENNECKTDIASENVDKGRSILGAPPKLEKKKTRNPRTKKVVKDKFFTPHGFISLVTHTTSTLLWILEKSLLKPKRVHIHKMTLKPMI